MTTLDRTVLLQSSRQRVRLALQTLALVAIWMTILFAYADEILDRWGVRGFIIGAIIPISALLVAAMNAIFGAPRCPHCRVRLVGSLFHAAMASGNCAYCGKHIID